MIIDAVDKGKKPGEIFDILQVPSSNLSKELQDFCNAKVIIKVCQIKEIPETFQSGLSDPLKKAVLLLAEKIVEEYFLT